MEVTMLVEVMELRTRNTNHIQPPQVILAQTLVQIQVILVQPPAQIPAMVATSQPMLDHIPAISSISWTLASIPTEMVVRTQPPTLEAMGKHIPAQLILVPQGALLELKQRMIIRLTPTQTQDPTPAMS